MELRFSENITEPKQYVTYKKLMRGVDSYSILYFLHTTPQSQL